MTKGYAAATPGGSLELIEYDLGPLGVHQVDIRPTDRVGAIGIGGLGHMALQLLDAWGCEVTAFSSNPSKEDEARHFGADHFVNCTENCELAKMGNTLDFIISTIY